MLADWLRSGLASGRVTTRYPGKSDRLHSDHGDWHTLAVPALSGSCDNPVCSCVDTCPTSAIARSDTGSLQVDTGACIACGLCVAECSEGALEWTPAIDLAASTRQGLAAGTRACAGDQAAAPRTAAGGRGGDWSELDAATLRQFRRTFGRSLHIRHIDVGSCNACESEVLALSNPYYNFHRLGLFFTSSLRQADVLLVTGALTVAMKEVLVTTYEAMPRPRIVIAAGVCPIHGGLFQDSPYFAGPLDQVLPVDAYVPGCPPTPYALIRALLLAVGREAAETDA